MHHHASPPQRATPEPRQKAQMYRDKTRQAILGCKQVPILFQYLLGTHGVGSDACKLIFPGARGNSRLFCLGSAFFLASPLRLWCPSFSALIQASPGCCSCLPYLRSRASTPRPSSFPPYTLPPDDSVHPVIICFLYPSSLYSVRSYLFFFLLLLRRLLPTATRISTSAPRPVTTAPV